MRIQTSTYYALIAMMELTSAPRQSVSAAEIAVKYDLPLSHLAKVMRSLGRARLVVASRGIGGGYRLADMSRSVTLYDVICLFEPPAHDEPDGADRIGAPRPADQALPLAGIFGEIRSLQREILSSTSFRTLVRLGSANGDDTEEEVRRESA